MILEPKKIKSVAASTCPPSMCHEVMGLDAMILAFSNAEFKPGFSLSSRSSLVPLPFLPVSSEQLRLLIFPLAILIPTCDSSSLAFHMICSVCKLNKDGDTIQPCHTLFPILNQSVVPYPVLAIAS